MAEKFRIVGLHSLPPLAALGLILAVSGGCSSEGSTFGGAGTSSTANNAGNSASNAGSSNTTQATGGNGNPMGGNGSTTGGNGNTSGNSNPTGGSAGNNGTGGDAPQGGTGGAPPTEPCPKPEGEICHEFFANDNARFRINYVNEFKVGQMVDGKLIEPGGVIWTAQVDATTANSPRQAEMVDNPQAANGKAIMVSVNTGYQEYDMLTGARLVDRTQLGVSGVRGAVRLENGNTILGVGDDKLRTFNSAGVQVGAECTLPGSGGDSLRVINRDPATGNLLLGRLLDLFIVNVQCQQQWTAKLPASSKAYSVFPRAGGGVYATSGEPATIIEYDMGGQIVKTVGGTEAHPGLGLDFFSGFEILPNGNFVAANWQGHNNAPGEDTPHLVEFTPTNEVVWTWGNQTLARQITNTLMLR